MLPDLFFFVYLVVEFSFCRLDILDSVRRPLLFFLFFLALFDKIFLAISISYVKRPRIVFRCLDLLPGILLAIALLSVFAALRRITRIVEAHHGSSELGLARLEVRDSSRNHQFGAVDGAASYGSTGKHAAKTR